MLCILAMGLALLCPLSLVGCTATAPKAPEGQPASSPGSDRTGARGAEHTGGTDRLEKKPSSEPEKPGKKADFWYKRFHPYMKPELRREYMQTPVQERFRRYGELLLDYQRREALLEPVKGKLDPKALSQYYRLNSLAECRTFVETLR